MPYIWKSQSNSSPSSPSIGHAQYRWLLRNTTRVRALFGSPAAESPVFATPLTGGSAGPTVGLSGDGIVMAMPEHPEESTEPSGIVLQLHGGPNSGIHAAGMSTRVRLDHKAGSVETTLIPHDAAIGSEHLLLARFATTLPPSAMGDKEADLILRSSTTGAAVGLTSGAYDSTKINIADYNAASVGAYEVVLAVCRVTDAGVVITDMRVGLGGGGELLVRPGAMNIVADPTRAHYIDAYVGTVLQDTGGRRRVRTASAWRESAPAW